MQTDEARLICLAYLLKGTALRWWATHRMMLSGMNIKEAMKARFERNNDTRRYLNYSGVTSSEGHINKCVEIWTTE